MKTQSINSRIANLILADLEFAKLIKYIQDQQALLAGGLVIRHVEETV